MSPLLEILHYYYKNRPYRGNKIQKGNPFKILVICTTPTRQNKQTHTRKKQPPANNSKQHFLQAADNSLLFRFYNSLGICSVRIYSKGRYFVLPDRLKTKSITINQGAVTSIPGSRGRGATHYTLL